MIITSNIKEFPWDQIILNRHSLFRLYMSISFSMFLNINILALIPIVSGMHVTSLIANCRQIYLVMEKGLFLKNHLAYWFRHLIQIICRSWIGNDCAIIDQLIITIVITIFLYSSKKRKSLIIDEQYSSYDDRP